MAKHPSAQKRNRQNQLRRDRNAALRSRMRNALKDARTAIASGSADKAAIVKNAIVEVSRSATKNILTKGTASRYVSRLMKAAAR